MTTRTVQPTLKPDTKPDPRARTARTRNLTIALTLSAGIGLTGWLLTRAPAGQPHADHATPAAHSGVGAPLRINTVQASALSVRAENALSGQIEPFRVATVAAEAANRIVQRPIQQGDRVVQGALLAALDSEAAETTLAQAQAALAQATAARRQAETDYQRAVVETDAALQQARAQVRQAIADRNRAEAGFDQASAAERKARAYTRAQELRQAEEALAQARADEKLARLEYNRYTFLVREGASSRQTLDRTETTLESATARREAAEQAVSLAREGARREDQEAAEAQSRAAKSQVQAADHQIEVARAGLRSAETRNTRLAVIRRQIDGLRAQEDQARESVRQARIALGKRRVVAPFSGRVLATLADVGDMMANGTPVVRLGEVAKVKALFSVPEASRPALRLGQPLTLTADALPGRTFTGRIHTLGFQADPRSRAFPVEIVIDNPDETLLPNMVARLRLPVGQTRQRVLIPTAAVAGEGQTTYVFVIEGDHAVRREVKLGAPFGNDVEVRSGLQPGERIAATPQRLTDNARVLTTPAQEVSR